MVSTQGLFLWLALHHILRCGQRQSIHLNHGSVKELDYSNTLTSPPAKTNNLWEIQAYHDAHEQKRIDLENVNVRWMTYLPTIRTIKLEKNYQGKVIFNFFQIVLVPLNKPIMDSSPLPSWLGQRCIYAIDTFNDSRCVCGKTLQFTKDMSVVKKNK